MRIIINGKAVEWDESVISIADVLKKNNVKKPEMVSVQLNEKFIHQDQFDTTNVKDNDDVDYIFFMGGGQNFINIK